jgi:phospholipid/cholesterol/gamma-HCH transport system permease protein
MIRFLKNFFKGIAPSLIRRLKVYGGIAALILYSIRSYFEDKKGRSRINKVIIMQVYFTGNLALKIISLVALALGAITVLQLFTQLSKFGALEYVGKILNIVIVRELGPILTAFIVISRSGTAIAAEIGTMMVNDEVNALEMLGINTLKFVAFPRIAGMVIAMVLLTIYFSAIGLIGGFLVGNIYADITFDMFSTYVMNSITVVDMLTSIIKSAVFGVFISTIAIYYGFQAFESTQIPQVTTKAVVSSIFALFAVDVFITLVTYL